MRSSRTSRQVASTREWLHVIPLPAHAARPQPTITLWSQDTTTGQQRAGGGRLGPLVGSAVAWLGDPGMRRRGRRKRYAEDGPGRPSGSVMPSSRPAAPAVPAR